MLKKCVLTILGLNWNQRLGHKKTKLNICHHMLTSPTQLLNRSFDVVERTRTSSKCQKMKNARAKRAKMMFFIVKYANLWGFCCRRRRGYLSSLMFSWRFTQQFEWTGRKTASLITRSSYRFSSEITWFFSCNLEWMSTLIFALTLRARGILLVFAKIYLWLLIPNCTRNHPIISIQIIKNTIAFMLF